MPSATHGSVGGERVSALALPNAMSVDVEDYFHVSGFSEVIDRDDWERLPRRVEANCDRILQLFDDYGVRATFFVLGWVAERHPGLVRRIVDGGHELASHGCAHMRVDRQTPRAFLSDAANSKKLLEDVSGAIVKGFRAPSFSIGKTNLWAFEIIAEAGYRYSSSINPIRHDHYGLPDAPRFPFYPTSDNRLVEIPITTAAIFGRRLPCGGGGFFRLMPYAAFARALQRVHRYDREPAIFYFHPWEIDAGQPRIKKAPWAKRARHYVNISRMESKLRRLLADFAWDRLDRIFGIE